MAHPQDVQSKAIEKKTLLFIYIHFSTTKLMKIQYD